MTIGQELWGFLKERYEFLLSFVRFFEGSAASYLFDLLTRWTLSKTHQTVLLFPSIHFSSYVNLTTDIGCFFFFLSFLVTTTTLREPRDFVFSMQEIDLAIGPLSPSEQRANITDWTSSFQSTSEGVFFRQEDTHDHGWIAYLSPFTWEVSFSFVSLVSFSFSQRQFFSDRIQTHRWHDQKLSLYPMIKEQVLFPCLS